jgi:membrane protein DedA with SNARE-associated domain
MLEQTITTLNSLPNETLYLFLFAVVVFEYLIPPLPGDTIMVLGAYFIGTGKLDLTTVYIVTTLGSIGGFLILFFVGKYYGRDFFLKKNYRLFSREMILKTEKWFQHYGTALIAANRFLAGGRSVISLIAGISNMKLSTITLAALFSCMIWNAILIAGGYFLGKNWQLVLTILKSYNQFITLVLVMTLIFFLWKKIKKRNSV